MKDAADARGETPVFRGEATKDAEACGDTPPAVVSSVLSCAFGDETTLACVLGVVIGVAVDCTTTSDFGVNGTSPFTAGDKTAGDCTA